MELDVLFVIETDVDHQKRNENRARAYFMRVKGFLIFPIVYYP